MCVHVCVCVGGGLCSELKGGEGGSDNTKANNQFCDLILDASSPT